MYQDPRRLVEEGPEIKSLETGFMNFVNYNFQKALLFLLK